MLIREYFEKIEEEQLSFFATLSKRSRGREKKEEECIIRTAFQRDRDRIIHSRAFRQLRHKTQVFLAPFQDHFRTRLTHTIEVAQIARTISKVLKLNEDLTEAIALGHDLGHPPFGHAGEQILNELCPEGFAHNEQSIRIVEFLEKEGEGLNLTEEVRDGIRHHSKGELGSLCRGKEALSLEAEVVRLSDCIAYINHDIQDALDAGVIKVEQLPSDCVKILGERYSQRIDMMVKDTILNSMGKEQVCMSPKVLEATEKLRSYLYEQVYTHPRIKKEAEKAKRVLEALYTLFTKNPSLLWSKMPFLEGKVCVHKAACDFLSLMGDREALTLYQNLFLPKPWSEGE